MITVLHNYKTFSFPPNYPDQVSFLCIVFRIWMPSEKVIGMSCVSGVILLKKQNLINS